MTARINIPTRAIKRPLLLGLFEVGAVGGGIDVPTTGVFEGRGRFIALTADLSPHCVDEYGCEIPPTCTFDAYIGPEDTIPAGSGDIFELITVGISLS